MADNINSKSNNKKPDISTKMIHGAYDPGQHLGATQIPIFQTSAFAHSSAEEMEEIFNNRQSGFVYSRLGNPTVNNFENRIRMAESGTFATACASGSAAIMVSLFNILRSGDEIIAPTGLYGGTLDMFRDLEAFGIHTVYANDFTANEIDSLIGESTKAVFAETIGNPKLNVVDIRAVADVCHKHGIPLIVDNTTATPVLVKPLELGADLVIHSSSKYINGNGAAISGVVIDGASFDWRSDKFSVMGEYQKFGKGAFTARLRNVVWRDFGPCLAPVHAWLNINGLETLGLRMKTICYNAAALAEALSNNPGVDEVRYPVLPDSPYRELAKRQFRDSMGGGILTIRVGSKKKAFAVINRLKYACNVSNIGDSKTLVVHPSSTIFAHSSESEKNAAGVYDDLIRISIGIESADDLIWDFEQALKGI